MALLFPGTETKTGGNPEDSRKTDIKTDETLFKDPRYQTVYDFILAEEGYAPIGKKDRNAFRAGYGSDTITHEDGSYSDVTEGMEYSREAAERDFARRLTGEFLPRVRHSVGKEVFDSLDANLLAILTSLTYNYGHIRPEVLNALKTGDREDVALAIQGLNPEDTQLVSRSFFAYHLQTCFHHQQRTKDGKVFHISSLKILFQIGLCQDYWQAFFQ